MSNQKGGADHLTGVSYVDLLVGNNSTNNSLNDLFNYCL